MTEGIVDLSAMADAVARDCLSAFPSARLKVTGTCMAPVLREGETVVLTSPRDRRPRFGDVVLARIPHGLRLHRVVWGWPLPGRVRLQADRGRLWDPSIEPGAVLATVIGVAEDPGRRVRSAMAALRSLLRGLWTRGTSLG